MTVSLAWETTATLRLLGGHGEERAGAHRVATRTACFSLLLQFNRSQTNQAASFQSASVQ